MPGKQMAIDADLNAGLITQDEARVRRAEVRAEADFYGSMDGASKFVRGDATAGIMILVINILGGLAIGVLAHDLAFSDAARTYTLLTIGDGLVAQIPALLLSTAVAVIVTRMSGKQDMGGEISRQLAQPKALYVAAGVIAADGPDSRHAKCRLPVCCRPCAQAPRICSSAVPPKPHAARQLRRLAPIAVVPPESRELTWEDVPTGGPAGAGGRLPPGAAGRPEAGR